MVRMLGTKDNRNMRKVQDTNRHRKNTKRQTFKRELKQIINTQHNEIRKESKEKTKLRFCQNAQKKNYIDQLGYQETKIFLKLRLNMTELKCNYKNKNNTNMKCDLCNVKQKMTRQNICLHIMK